MSLRTILIPLLVLMVCGPCVAEDHGHEHGEGHGHGEEAPAIALGDVTIAGTTYSVSAHGEIHAGHEAVLSIAITAGDAPESLRAWIGVANGRGSVKALLDGHEGHYHGHLEVPAELPEGSAVWLGVATGGERARGQVALPAAHDHAGEEHAEHDHADHADEHAGHDHAEGDHAGHGHEGHDH